MSGWAYFLQSMKVVGVTTVLVFIVAAVINMGMPKV